MNVVKINQVDIDQAAAVLSEALDEHFETVIVLGFKAGEVMIKSSFNPDFLRMLGALEVAKAHILAGE